MPHLGKKQRDLYVNKKCSHEKNEVTYSQQNRITIAKHVIQGGLKGERRRKRQQFATILHMLKHGRLMLEFEAMKSLFSFLNVLMNLENHWSDSIGWVMAKCLHKQMIKKNERSCYMFEIFCPFL